MRGWADRYGGPGSQEDREGRAFRRDKRCHGIASERPSHRLEIYSRPSRSTFSIHHHHPMSHLPASQTEGALLRDNEPVNYGAVSSEGPSSYTDTSERQLPEAEGATQPDGAANLNFRLFKSLFWDSIPSTPLVALVNVIC